MGFEWENSKSLATKKIQALSVGLQVQNHKRHIRHVGGMRFTLQHGSNNLFCCLHLWNAYYSLQEQQELLWLHMTTYTSCWRNQIYPPTRRR